MDAAFGWIGDFLRWIVCFLPHLALCRATHGGVKFVRGKKVRAIRPGLFFWWPLVTEYVIVPTVRHPVDLPAQTLTTSDGKRVLVSVTLVVEISDVVKALGKTWDVDEMICDVGAASSIPVVCSRKWSELRREVEEACEDLAKEARALLRPYGIRVVKGRFTDLAECMVIRHEGSGGAAAVVPTEEE
jgi:regulator of protease activity HflC (stomatin/prohibitin superfamily)